MKDKEIKLEINDKLYLALLHSLGISHKKLYIIFEENLFKKSKNKTQYKDFYENLTQLILEDFGFKNVEISNILNRRQKIKISDLDKMLESRNVEIITIKDDKFPEELKNIPNVPYLLYVRGKISTGPKIAVVGSRNITSYGKRVIEKLVPEISKYFVIVSGGAYGCDTSAHNVALNSGNKTISVIGTSIMEDYPVGNQKMYNEIIEKEGAIISIFPIGVPGSSFNFPVRNEIVAGLSVGTLVVEAKERSGSLITARLALDLGKDLFAIPGEIFKSNSAGCNNLIKKGEAKTVLTCFDILEEYNFSNKSSSNGKEKIKVEISDEIERKIYETLLVEGFSIDDLSKKLRLDVTTLSFKISMLEINGLIKKTLGGKYEIS